MNILVIGLNHRTAPVEIRERFAISSEQIVHSLNHLVYSGIIREAAILSTCNRVEVYAVCDRIEEAKCIIFDFLKKQSGIETLAQNLLYIHEMPASVRHLYEVCSSLDSMVIGETEILGQAKEAYHLAHRAHRTGFALNKLFQTAFSVAKEIRSSTCVGMGSVSIGSVAVDLASQIFGNLGGRKIMLIGAGEMGEATARALKSRGAQSLLVTNRSHDRAGELAKSLDGQVVHWNDWYKECHSVDIVISSTAAPHCIITREQIEPVIKQRMGVPLFFIDIAVPRDIEREVAQLEGVYLYDIDDLQVIADQNLAMRQKEAAVCKQIIRGHVDKFEHWFIARAARFAQRSTDPQLDALRKGWLPA